MIVAVLASGSRGNAAVFAAENTRLLVDAGIGPRVLAERLTQAGIEGGPTAILITHGHLDHTAHALKIAKRWRIPIYVSEATSRMMHLGSAPEVFLFAPRDPFRVGDLIVSPMPLPHDAAQVGLSIEGGGRRAALATDLGEVPPRFDELIAGADVVLLESNHDADMLERGPYPPHLKRRIASARGHLSNVQTHEVLRRLPASVHSVALMHLSETNNRADLALDVARDAIGARPLRLFAASQSETLVLDAAAPLLPPRGAQLTLAIDA